MDGEGRLKEPTLCLTRIMPYPCQFCDQVFYTTSSREAHNSSAHAPPPQTYNPENNSVESSTSCDQPFPKMKNVKKHTLIHGDSGGTGKRFKCSTCVKVFHTKSSLMNHMILHRGDKPLPFECSTCNMSFITQGNLTKHMKTHTRRKTYECFTCGKLFTHKEVLGGALQKHIETHTTVRAFLCITCGESFGTTYERHEHMTTHSRGKSYECFKPGKTFSRRKIWTGTLQKHSETQRSGKQFACSTCAQSFDTRDELHFHILAHGVENPFKCSTCGKIFSADNYLNSRTLASMGTQSKPFECSTCGEEFAKEIHANADVGSMPVQPITQVNGYACPLCSEKFDWPSDRRYHMRGHSTIFGVRCEICKCGFRNPTLLTKHVEKEHSILGL